MSGYDNDTNGDGLAGLNVDGGAVKQPLKPKASGKADLSSPSYDRNSMVRHCAWRCISKQGHATLYMCCALAAFKCVVHRTATMLSLCLLTVLLPFLLVVLSTILGELTNRAGRHVMALCINKYCEKMR